MRKIILLGGPTASGKSKLALEWADDVDGEIINADSMQIYRELNVLTACPSRAELNKVPHHLYRVLAGDDPCSAERWRDMARVIIDDIWLRGKTPIVVGGTGLYLKALVYGLSKVPEIDEAIRREVRDEVEQSGAEVAHVKLKSIDPEMAARLAPADKQRISRALEVVLSTGRSLAKWQEEPETGGLCDEKVGISKHVLLRERALLYQRCNQRFEYMINQGDALEEVRRLSAFNYDENLPVMKALGVPQIIDFLNGKTINEEMINLSQTATRQFAKRQLTWFRNQFSDWKIEKM